SSAASAPASSAPRVSRIASAVELEPVPAITGTRRRARRTTSRTTSTCSSCVSVAASPVEPQGTSPCVPASICRSTSAASARRSISPARKGVTSAVMEPVSILHLDAAFEDLDRVPGHVDVIVGPPVDVELAAREPDHDPPLGPPRACRGGGGRTGARAAAEGLTRAALPHPHQEPVACCDADELGVHPPREEGVVLEARSDLAERQPLDVVHE